jgi:flagellar biosynthesis/type III secretory pathway M-ring protein FliF/YscJ
MANYNDNDLEELDFGEEGQNPQAPQEPKSSNRNFLIALGIIGGVFVLITIALIVVATLILPGRNKASQQAGAATLAANTATAQFATDEAQKAIILLTPSITPIPSATKPAPATNTPVVAPTQTSTSQATVAPTNTAASDAQKATLSAQQTQLASGKFTATVIATSTALPNTGFADEFGLPGLLGLGLGLILIIFLARRLRSSPTAAR